MMHNLDRALRYNEAAVVAIFCQMKGDPNASPDPALATARRDILGEFGFDMGELMKNEGYTQAVLHDRIRRVTDSFGEFEKQRAIVGVGLGLIESSGNPGIAKPVMFEDRAGIEAIEDDEELVDGSEMVA